MEGFGLGMIIRLAGGQLPSVTSCRAVNEQHVPMMEGPGFGMSSLTAAWQWECFAALVLHCEVAERGTHLLH